MSFAETSEKLLQPTLGHSGFIPHVGEFGAARPMRQKVAVAGYGGFRPRTTPDTML